MCGIAGICHLSGSHEISLDSIRQMTEVVKHRGPDETGIYLADKVAMGHARLSIIDLSSGSQPIRNEDSTLWIVYNGEVFNYKELRKQLTDKGHKFYTTSDTEVLIHMYEEYREDMLEMLNGQFAFAIWDTNKEELFMARDRVGIRPLHFTVHNGMLLFASEIKSIFTVKGIPREIDPAAMEQIFTFWTTLPGFTAFKGIHELKPGHFLKVSKGEIKTHRYWDIPLPDSRDHIKWSTDQISEHVSELLLDAVRMRLRADVPVGSYLSGGLDSSGITAMIVRNFDNDVKTFGIRFQEQQFDEGDHQKEMVEYLNAKHSEIYATNDKIGNALPDVVWHAEKPLLRTSPVPLYLLSQLVRDSGLKVVLTGEGADEIFGGYNIFREVKIRRFLARFPDSAKRLGLIAQLYPYIFSDRRLKSSMQSFFTRGLDEAQGPLFSHLLRWKNTSRIKTFFSEDMKRRTSETDVFQQVSESIPANLKDSDYLAKAQYLEMSIFMSNYLLSSQGDRVAMANSVEIRLPYLDPNVMEFMAKVPARWKILGLTEKHMLKKVFTGILPPSIIERKKHPYRAPIVKSLLCSDAFDYSAEMLSDTAITKAGIFDPHKVSKLINKIKAVSAASEIDSMALAGILTTQLINDRFIENFTAPPKSEHMPDLLVDQRKHVAQNR